MKIYFPFFFFFFFFYKYYCLRTVHDTHVEVKIIINCINRQINLLIISLFLTFVYFSSHSVHFKFVDHDDFMLICNTLL